MWILPKNPFSAMSNLRRLLVADVPSSWDISWPHLLIQAAPLLESLYVHASHGEDEPSQEVPGKASSSRHRHLKELVVIGFQRTERQQWRLQDLHTRYSLKKKNLKSNIRTKTAAMYSIRHMTIILVPL
jgi:hypothetical protein